jgi:hypothetical protein
MHGTTLQHCLQPKLRKEKLARINDVHLQLQAPSPPEIRTTSMRKFLPFKMASSISKFTVCFRFGSTEGAVV